MKRTLWTRDFTRITAATTLGAAGGIISQFALSFLVFDETGSTLAAALTVAIQLIPMVLLPLIIAPMMDRLPRTTPSPTPPIWSFLCWYRVSALSTSWPTTAFTLCCCRRGRRSGHTPFLPCSTLF